MPKRPILRPITLIASMLVVCYLIWAFENPFRSGFQHARYLLQYITTGTVPPQRTTTTKQMDCEIPRISNDSSILCRQYDVDPFTPLQLSRTFPNTPVVCKEEEWVIMRNGTITVDGRLGNVTCTFKELLRSHDWENIVVRTVEVTSNQSFTAKYSDTIKVRCKNHDTGKTWKDVLFSSKRLPHCAPRTGWQYLHPDGLQLNVFVWMFESISKNAFIRLMRKSWRFMEKEMKGILFNGHNILGSNTVHAVVPLLTGERYLNSSIYKYYTVQGRYMDDVTTFIFTHFSRQGYVTALYEDCPFTHVFYSIASTTRGGFREKTADHYSRAYMWEKASMGKECCYCSGNRTMNQFAQEYMKDLWLAYPDKPKFFHSFVSYATHTTDNTLDSFDVEFKPYLRWLNQIQNRNNSLIIIMGDHGQRFSYTSQTKEGLLEMRVPFLYMLFPDWVDSLYPEEMSNLRTNAKERLTTHVDLHQTLRHMLNMKAPEHNGPIQDPLPLGISLFRPIPKWRTCHSAQISGHFCGCLEFEDVDPSLKVVQDMAAYVVQFMNEKVDNLLLEYARKEQSMRFTCLGWTKVKVLHASLAYNKVRPDQYHYYDTYGIKSPLDIVHNYLIYELKFTAEPGPTEFRASVRHYVGEQGTEEYSVEEQDITVQSLYKHRAWCIRRSMTPSAVLLEKWCYCEKTV